MTSPITIHVVPHTHWDREWYEPFEIYRWRLVKMADRLLDVLETDPDFTHFNFDGQTAAIEDYLEIRPGARPRIEALVASGRLAVGPWRILMDEFLCSGETIVRNLQQGTHMAASLGRVQRLGYIPDSFGHIAQMPQLLRLAGFEYATTYRGVPGAVDRTMFDWVAPDGSTVRTVYLATTYSNAAWLPDDADELLARMRRVVADLRPFEPGDVLLAMNGTDHRPPEEHLPALLAKANATQDEVRFRIGSMEEYLRDAPRDGLPVWHGEMRSGARANLLPGVASARMPLKQAEFRASALLERYAEPLAALAWLDQGRYLERAWRWMVENSAHDSICGCGIDEVAVQVHARYVQAARKAEQVTAEALGILAASCDTSFVRDDGILVWNPSPRARGGAVEVTLPVPGEGTHLAFRAHDGSLHPAQPISIEHQVMIDMTMRGAQLGKLVPTINSRWVGTHWINGVTIENGKHTTVRMRLGSVQEDGLNVDEAKRMVEAVIARKPHGTFRVIGEGPPLVRALVQTPEIGAMGWTTLEPIAQDAPATNAARAAGHVLDNGIIRAEVAADGTLCIVADGVRYEGVLGVEDGGDAGDEYNYSPPEKDLVVRAPADDVVVDEIAAGPVEATLRITRRFRVPAGLSHDDTRRAKRTTWLPVITDVSLRAGEPFLRARIEIHNEATDHRVRALLPLPFRAERSHADQAFHVVARGLDAEGGIHERGIPTYPSRRWVDASDGARGLAIFHRGTPEYELVDGSTLAITLLRCVGWLSRQGMQYRSGPAGPKLATPGAQLRGAHVFELAIYPHAGDWRAARVHDVAEAFTYALRATLVRAHEGPLPPAAASLRIEPQQVQLSALQKQGEHVFLRIYNAADEPVDASITVPPTWRGMDVCTVGLLGDEHEHLDAPDGTVTLPMRAWEIATVRIG